MSIHTSRFDHRKQFRGDQEIYIEAREDGSEGAVKRILSVLDVVAKSPNGRRFRWRRRQEKTTQCVWLCNSHFRSGTSVLVLR